MKSSRDPSPEPRSAHGKSKAPPEQRDLPRSAATAAISPDAWFTPGRFALIFGVLVVVCFPQVVFGFETFFFRDFDCFTYPGAFFQRECFWRGRLPLWNPYNDCGIPFLAQWNTAALYPPSLFYLIFPLSWSLGVFCLAHLLFAAIGMYFLAYRWTGNRLAASVAGTVFGFNGLTWYMLMWTSNLAAVAWMPWVVLAVERAWQTGTRRDIVLAALAGGMQMLTGSPEAILLTWLFLAVLWVVRCFRAPSGLAQWARFAVIPCLIAGLAAVQLLPFMELLAHSQRSAAFGDSLWAMPRTGWANYLVPLFHYFRTMQGTYTPHDQYWAASYYVGTATIVLALLAVWKVRDAETWVAAILTALCLVLALGDAGGLFELLRRLAPAIRFMRYPIKFVMLPTFLIPLLAARGLTWLQALPEKEATQRERLLWLAGAVVFAIVAIVFWAWIHPAESEQPIFTMENGAVRIAFLALIVGCVLVFRRVREHKLQLLLRVSLLLLFWFDVRTHAPQFHPTVGRSAYEPDLIREFFKWDSSMLKPGDSRAMRSIASTVIMPQSWINDPEKEVFGRRLSLYPNCNLLDHASVLDGFFSLELRNYSQFYKWFLTHAETNEMAGLKNFLGVAQVTDPTNNVNWLPREGHLPVITAGQEPIFTDDQTALEQMVSNDFDPVRQVYMPPEARAAVTAKSSDAKIHSSHFENERLDAEVETGSSAMMVIAQSFYSPWRAYVDDHPVQLWQANYAFQALEIPAGRHKVRLVYEDRAFEIGAAISLGTLALCIIGWIWKRKPVAVA